MKRYVRSSKIASKGKAKGYSGICYIKPASASCNSIPEECYQYIEEIHPDIRSINPRQIDDLAVEDGLIFGSVLFERLRVFYSFEEGMIHTTNARKYDEQMQIKKDREERFFQLLEDAGWIIEED